MKSDRKTLTRIRAILMERKIFVFNALGMCDHNSGLQAFLSEALRGLDMDIRLAEQSIMELRWQTD